MLCSLEVPGLHSIFSAIVDFRGYRVLCQSIIPGILNQNPQTTTQYGSIDDGQTIATEPVFHEMMKGICEKVYLDKSVILDKAGGSHELWGAMDTKGIKGSDQRMYFLEALRMTPRDSNYMGEQFSLCLLRPELLEQYQQMMQSRFIEAKMKEIISTKPSEENKIPWEDFQEMIKSYPKVTFNPNVFTGVDFFIDESNPDSFKLSDAEAKVKDLSQFLLEYQLPGLVKMICAEDGCWAKLGNTFPEVLHKFGINLRYLGKMCELLTLEEHRHIRWMFERYAAARSAKHVFNEILRETPEIYLADKAAQLLNSLVEVLPQKNSENSKKKRKRKRGKKEEEATETLIPVPRPKDLESEAVWGLIRNLTLSHFGIPLPEKIGFWEAVGSTALLISFKKEICLQIGLQIDSASNISARISPNSISGFSVKVKSLDWKSVESRWLYEAGMKSINEQNTEVGIDMLIQSAGIQAQISTVLHPEVASVYQKLSQVCFSQNHLSKAIRYQHQALLIYERVLGLDHPTVGNSYINLACYYQTAGKFARCLLMYKHALQIFLINYGELCPEVVFILVSLGIMYGDANMHEISIGVLYHVVNMCLALYGEKSMFVAEYSHILATEYKIVKEFNAAQQNEMRALEIMRAVLQADDKRIQDCENCIEEIARLVRENESQDKKRNSDPKTVLKQKLNARRVKAKLGIPTHQLHLAYPVVEERGENMIRARQLTEQLQKTFHHFK